MMAAAPRQSARVIAGLFFCLHVMASALAAVSLEHPEQLRGVWLTAASSFLLLTIAWRGVVPRLTRGLATSAAAIVATTFIAHLLAGATVATAVWFAVGVLVHGIVLALIYRRLRESVETSTHPSGETWYADWRANWAPRQTWDLVAFAPAAVIASACMSLWGTNPDQPMGSDPRELVLFFTAYAITALIAGPSLLILAQQPRVEVQGRNLLLLVALSSATSLCVVTALRSPELPMSWIVLVPALAAGSTLRPWAAAAHCMIQGSVALAYSQARVDLSTWAHPFATELMMTILTGVIVLLTLTVSLMQRDRARLDIALGRQRQRAVDQTALLQTVLAEMGDGVMVTDDLGNLTFHNRAVETLLPLAPEQWGQQAIPSGLTVLASGGRRIKDIDELRAHFAAGGTLQELIVHGDDPVKRRTLEISHRSVRLGNEKRMVTMCRDVTTQRQREGDMQALARSAAHALQEPLATLRSGLATSLEAATQADLPAVGGFLHKAATGGERLAGIIDDWSGFSIERSGELDLQTVALAPEIATAAARLGDGSGIAQYAVDVTATHHVTADPALLRQLLSNLLGNGMKYRRPGVMPKLQVTSTQHRTGWVRVEVVDNGIGIAPGDEESIFEPFHRSSSIRESFEGSGLGLATCRDIVSRHGGRIWAHRNPDVGSTVAFTLPEAVNP